MEDVRTRRGDDIASDHHLMVAKMKLKLNKQWTTGQTASSCGIHTTDYTEKSCIKDRCIPTRNPLEDSDFTDHLALLSHTQQQITVSVAAASASLGLNIHKGRSKILKFNTKNINPIILDGEALEEVESSTYLSSSIDEQGGSDADVNLWIGKEGQHSYNRRTHGRQNNGQDVGGGSDIH
ncbi:unnamed protein product [Schistosoma curassoni]|uniref:Uncharacterized protein n=1 Tax=Schistosoma curassoni TaxID=6186 RepID=A0A183JVG7_9TREM|nr:unnamed protein product [Schistosoma curassoni]